MQEKDEAVAAAGSGKDRRILLDRLLSLPTHDLPLARNSLAAAVARTPLYFVASMACFTFLGSAYWGRAPAGLLVVLPVVVFGLAALRVVAWVMVIAPRLVDAEVVPALRRFTIESLVLVACLAGWPLLLYPYADEKRQVLTAFNFGLVTIACMYCMMHMRLAIQVSLVLAPASVYYLVSAEEWSTRIAFIGIFTSVLVTTNYMIFRYAREFDTLSRQRDDLERLSDENFQMANLDALTGLANRRRFFSDVAELQARVGDGVFAVALVDLDGFKPINDIHGHVVGDGALKMVASRLAVECGRAVRTYRIGGDEFGLLIDGACDDASLTAIGRRVIERLSRPMTVSTVQLSLGASVGFARYPEATRRADQLYERADYALYNAKRNGRGRCVIFDRSHETALSEGGAIEQALKQADIESEFFLLFQPMINARTGRTLAFECLARWQSPVLGAVSPAKFIPVAEHAGVIGNLTAALLRKALAAARTWPEEISLSFNLSAHDVCVEGQADALIAIIRGSGIEPARVEFELTETAVTYNFHTACNNMRLLREAGARIALDDFGTGYSSLSHVHLLPLDKIKIDRSFVRDIERRGVSHKIVKSVSGLCRDLGLDCIAEGVELGDQVRTLAEMGCDVIQGYYYARPMALDATGAFLSPAGRPAQEASEAA